MTCFVCIQRNMHLILIWKWNENLGGEGDCLGHDDIDFKAPTSMKTLSLVFGSILTCVDAHSKIRKKIFDARKNKKFYQKISTKRN